jgi:exonuclease SbcC
MRPLRLTPDWFGSYRQPTEAGFSDVDFFALTGPTGGREEHADDGLCLALYGTVPAGEGERDRRRARPRAGPSGR